MKKYILFLAFISLILLNACSSEPPAATNATNVGAPNTNAISEQTQAANTNLVPLDNFKNANVNVNDVKVIVPSNANQKNTTPMAVPAPFNSSVMTTMTKDGKFLETRNFKDDPLILKMERLQEAKKIKVYFKNGKSAELPYEKGFTLFTSGSPQDILTAAGIAPPATPPAVNPKKVEETKKKEQ
jgi:hypothetical protein